MGTRLVSRTAFVLLLAYGAAMSQQTTLYGRVTNVSGQGLAGATVYLQARALTTTSAAGGYFQFSWSSPVALRESARPAAKATMHDGTVRFVVAGEAQDVRLDVLDMAGRCLRTPVRERLAPGVYEAEALKSGTMPGLALVRLRVGSEESSFRCLRPAESLPNAFAGESSEDTGLPKGVRAAAIDSVLVSLSGYYPGRAGVDAYTDSALVVLQNGPAAGYAAGGCTVPANGQAANVSTPDHVVGTGTPGSCTGQAFINAVALGGTIVFNCGPDPVTITLTQPAKVVNNADPDIVIDGGGKVTLSGGGTTRILYMNTCDSVQHWTTSHCQDQDHPRLTVQNLTFVDGNSRGVRPYDGGGAIWSRGGKLKIVNCRFFNNTCDSVGPDVGGAAVRAFDQSLDSAVYVVNSTFGGAQGFGNYGSNGGGVSSIGVSWTIINSLFSYNRAIGNGGNPASSGTPGGGSGGAIYNDGNYMELRLCGCLIEQNRVNAYGASIFFVTNDHSGKLFITNSIIRSNIGGSWYPFADLPTISLHDDTYYEKVNSTITY